MIATVAELDALPEGSVILDDGWYPKVKGENGKWWRPDCAHGVAAAGTVLPTRLLWTPDGDDDLTRDAIGAILDRHTTQGSHGVEVDFPSLLDALTDYIAGRDPS